MRKLYLMFVVAILLIGIASAIDFSKYKDSVASVSISDAVCNSKSCKFSYNIEDAKGEIKTYSTAVERYKQVASSSCRVDNSFFPPKVCTTIYNNVEYTDAELQELAQQKVDVFLDSKYTKQESFITKVINWFLKL